MKKKLQLLFILFCMVNVFAQEYVSQEKEIISGIVIDEDGNPFPNVNVYVIGQANGTQTNAFGNYSLSSRIGEQLDFSFKGYENRVIKVLSGNPININMQRVVENQEDIVTLAMGLNKKKDKIGHSYTQVNNQLITQANNPSALLSLDGKVSGIDVISSNNGGSPSVRFRGSRSIRGDNDALIVIDGAISSSLILESLDPNLIQSMTVLKGATGAALYGSQGSNGVLVVKTKRGTRSSSRTRTISKPKLSYYKGKLKVSNQTIIPDYIKTLSKLNTNEDAYQQYIIQKQDYVNNAAYYIDVYNYFHALNSKDHAKRVLDNIVESEMNNFEMLKGLAFQLEANNDYDLASSIYKRLVILKPDVAQSYLDLAQIYGKVNKPQKAFDILNSLLTLTKEANNLNTIVKHDINALKQAKPDIDTKEMESYFSINTEFDLRIIASWNRENTNVNLEIIEPSKEFASIENIKTQTGGQLKASNNNYGPVEYSIRNAKSGEYFVRLVYNGNLPNNDTTTFVKLNIYKNYGKKNQKEMVKIIKLNVANGEDTVACIKI